ATFNVSSGAQLYFFRRRPYLRRRVDRAGAADGRRGVEGTAVAGVEVELRAAGDVEGRPRARHAREVERPALHEELAAALRGQGDADGGAARAGGLPDEVRVDEGGRAEGAVEIDVAVALEVDRAAVGQHGVAAEVEVAGGEGERAGVVEGAAVDDDRVDGDGGAAGDAERSAAAEGAAAPGHGRGGDVDRRGAVEGAGV